MTDGQLCLSEKQNRCQLTFSTSTRILTKRWPEKWYEVIDDGDDAVLSPVGREAIAHIFQLHDHQFVLPEESSLAALRDRFAEYADALDSVIKQHEGYSCVSGMTAADLTWLMNMFALEFTMNALRARVATQSSAAVQVAALKMFRGEDVTEQEGRILNQAWDQFFDAKLDEEKPQPIRRATPKIGRNELCRCGSGKKFKRCCAT